MLRNSLCELIHRGKVKRSNMRANKLDRNHAVFIERTREGDQLYSILATKSHSDTSDTNRPSHRKHKRRGTMISIWRNIFLTGTFFFLLVLLAALSWLVITMKFKLESLEVKVIRLGNDVDSLLRKQVSWATTLHTISSISDQIKEIKADINKAQIKSREQMEFKDLVKVQETLQKVITDLQLQLTDMKKSQDAKSIWTLLSSDANVLCDIKNKCPTEGMKEDDGS